MCLGVKAYAFGHRKQEFSKGMCSWRLNGIHLWKGSEDSSKTMSIHLTLVKSVLSLSHYVQQDESKATHLARLPLHDDHDTTILSPTECQEIRPKAQVTVKMVPSLKWPSELISLCQMPAIFQPHKQKCKLLGHSLSFIEFSTSTDLNQLLTLPQLAIPFHCVSWNL